MGRTQTLAAQRFSQQLARACSVFGSASKDVKRASQRFRHASKRRWKRFKRASQRFAAPFSIVSQYAGAKRVRERFAARFAALQARRKASPQRFTRAFQRRFEACLERCEARLKRFQRRFEACLKRSESRLKRFQRRFEACLTRCEARLTCFEALPDTLQVRRVPARIVERRAFASGPTSHRAGFFSENPYAHKELSGNLLRPKPG